MSAADATLPGMGDAGTPPARWVETAILDAVKAASLDERDKGMGALAVACARAVDLAGVRQDPYALASTARELRETLIRLRLDPLSRMGNDAGGIESWLSGLGATDDETAQA